ncbi:Protein RKD4, partial [Camellia lanceoleosa]
MDSPKVQLHVPKVEKNHNEFDWLYLEKQTQGMYDQQLTFTDSFDQFMNSFMEFDLCQTPYQNNHIIHFEGEVKRQSSGNGRSKCAALELDEIHKYFDVLITKAAKECRELNIMRWPHRKIKSLRSLIDNVK